MDPVANPYAPGAGEQPPVLAGREEELRRADVLLRRIEARNPQRSVVLVGLRGVGKTVLLVELRRRAQARGWGTAHVEAVPDVALRRALARATHQALRELGRRRPADALRRALAVLSSFSLRTDPTGSLTVGVDVAPAKGLADSGALDDDLTELFATVGEAAADLGVGVALHVDEMQDLVPTDLGALCAACHHVAQERLPVIVVGAGLPNLPAALGEARTYAERLFEYLRIDRLERDAAIDALAGPAAQLGVAYEPGALDRLAELTGGYPYFVQCFGKAVWDVAPGSPITELDVELATPAAEADLEVGFFASRWERASPAERRYLLALAELGGAGASGEVARRLGRSPQQVSPLRDRLLRKGLVYAPDRGSIAFTVPHFDRYVLSRTS